MFKRIPIVKSLFFKEVKLKPHFSLVTICFYLALSALSAQPTYSKVYDLHPGQNDRLRDMALSHNEVVLVAEHACFVDTFLNASCTSINRFQLNNGKHLKTVLLDSVFPEGNERLLLYDDTYFLSGHLHSEWEERATLIYAFDDTLGLKNLHHINTILPGFNNNEGLIAIDTQLYLYGYNLAPGGNSSKGYISKIDLASMNVLWEKLIPSQHQANSFHHLQKGPNGDLVLMNEYGGLDGLELIQLDTSASINNIFSFDDAAGDLYARCLANSTGDYYFASALEPGTIFPSTGGRFNKLDQDFSTLDWSVLLPISYPENPRIYKVFDIIEASNGDIVVCGYVWDAYDGTLIGNHGTWNGFISRLTTEGELVWHHIYKHPNNIAPLSETGRYRPSICRKIQETPEGGFIVAGDIWYNTTQLFALEDNTIPLRRVWLLAVDENGCLENEECEEIIVLDQINNNENYFHIGTKWTYEVEIYGFPHEYYTSEVYEIIDTTTIADSLTLVVEKASTGHLFYMHEVEDKIYFWNPDLEQFVLHYDFASNTSYEAPWDGVCHDDHGIATVYVDSIVDVNIQGHSFTTQYLGVDNSGTEEGTLYNRVFVGIGNDNDLILRLGWGLCDEDKGITKLRCFENRDTSFSFVDYACDSTFIISNTVSPALDGIHIYPNPSSGWLNFKGLGAKKTAYALFDLRGSLIQSGYIQSEELFLDVPKGMYIISLQQGQAVGNYRIIID